MKVVISSGHGLKVRGASGIIDEVDEARLVTNGVAEYLIKMGVDTVTFHDDVSTTQNENLERIVDFHNSQGPHDWDVSVHFNAFEQTDQPMGTEVWFYSASQMANDVSEAIAGAGGFIDRGPKKSTSLYFLAHTVAPSVLLEVCFVDSEADCEHYEASFDEICGAIARAIVGEQIRPKLDVPHETMFHAEGTVSHFGGPNDAGVAPDEGLAFIYDYDTAPYLFLDAQPTGTSGLARRLNPAVPYVACRWDYSITPKDMLAKPYPALVRAKRTGRELLALPADWGPHEEQTGRAADISPGLMHRLGIVTDDIVEVIYPAPLGKA